MKTLFILGKFPSLSRDLFSEVPFFELTLYRKTKRRYEEDNCIRNDYNFAT